MKIHCPYCRVDNVEYVDMLDRNLDSYVCNEREEYFYVETYKGEVQDIRKQNGLKVK